MAEAEGKGISPPDETQSDAARFVELFSRLWAEPDPERFADLFHPNGGFRHPGGRTVTREQNADYWRRVLSRMPDLKLHPTAWATSGDWVFIEWSASATLAGRKIEWAGVTRFVLRGDRAVEGVAYFDPSQLQGTNER